mmetsp:Transcript_33107/g.106495  ORF Transcript_33107/g.106495 Transcript_33107/m.106495 type:complete len:292 (+) Transcript_33107:680-1555(+)
MDGRRTEGHGQGERRTHVLRLHARARGERQDVCQHQHDEGPDRGARGVPLQGRRQEDHDRGVEPRRRPGSDRRGPNRRRVQRQGAAHHYRLHSRLHAGFGRSDRRQLDRQRRVRHRQIPAGGKDQRAAVGGGRLASVDRPFRLADDGMLPLQPQQDQVRGLLPLHAQDWLRPHLKGADPERLPRRIPAVRRRHAYLDQPRLHPKESVLPVRLQPDLLLQRHGGEGEGVRDQGSKARSLLLLWVPPLCRGQPAQPLQGRFPALDALQGGVPERGPGGDRGLPADGQKSGGLP